MSTEERVFLFLTAAGGSVFIAGLFDRAGGHWTSTNANLVLVWGGLGLAIASLLVLMWEIPLGVQNWLEGRRLRRSAAR